MSPSPSSDLWRTRISNAGRDLPRDPFVSEWRTATQTAITRFAEATDDLDPLHIDPEWTRANTPIGGTIAQGLWVASMWVSMLHATQRLHAIEQALGVKRGLGLNYGYDRMRFLTPTFIGARLRGRFRFQSLDARGDDTAVLVVESEMEIEGQAKPCLAAMWLLAFLRADAHD